MQTDIIGLLTEVTNEIVSESNKDSLLKKILKVTTEKLKGEAYSLFLYNEDNDKYCCEAGAGYSSNIEGNLDYAIGEGLTGLIAKERKLYNLNFEEVKELRNAGKSIGKGDTKQWGKEAKFRNVIGVPLTIQDKILGILKVENKVPETENKFSEEDEKTIKIIANVVASALSNYVLNKRNDELQKLISNVSETVVKVLEEKNLLLRIVHITMEILKAEACSIYLKDKNSDIIDIAAAEGYHGKIKKNPYKLHGKGLTAYIVRTGEIFNIDLEQLIELKKKGIAERQADKYQWGEEDSNKFRNLIAVPIINKQNILGVIKVENKLPKEKERFLERDLDTLKIIANITATAIENARFHKKQEDELRMVSAKAAHKLGNLLVLYEGLIPRIEELGKTHQIAPEELSLIVERINETTEGAKSIVRDFTRYSKPIELKRELNNLNDLIKENIVDWQLKYSSIEINTELDNKIAPFCFDKTIIIQNIHELVLNAYKAIKDNGEVFVKTILVTERKIVEIRVENTNSAIEESFVEQLFIPFRSKLNGTGLGLANARKEIEAHGGIINFDESISNRIVFIITIPYQTENN